MQGRDATRRRDVRTLYYTPMSAKDAAREAERGTGHAARSAPASGNSADAVNAHYDTRLPELPWSRRIKNPVIAPAVFCGIFFLGPALRYESVGLGAAAVGYASGDTWNV